MNAHKTIKGHGLTVGDVFDFFGTDGIPTASADRVKLSKEGVTYVLTVIDGQFTGSVVARFGAAKKVWAGMVKVTGTYGDQSAPVTQAVTPVELTPVMAATLGALGGTDGSLHGGTTSGEVNTAGGNAYSLRKAMSLGWVVRREPVKGAAESRPSPTYTITVRGAAVLAAQVAVDAPREPGQVDGYTSEGDVEAAESRLLNADMADEEIVSSRARFGRKVTGSAPVLTSNAWGPCGPCDGTDAPMARLAHRCGLASSDHAARNRAMFAEIEQSREVVIGSEAPVGLLPVCGQWIMWQGFSYMVEARYSDGRMNLKPFGGYECVIPDRPIAQLMEWDEVKWPLYTCNTCGPRLSRWCTKCYLCDTWGREITEESVKPFNPTDPATWDESNLPEGWAWVLVDEANGELRLINPDGLDASDIAQGALGVRVTDADMREQVTTYIQAIGMDVEDFDVAGIVDRIQARYGTVDINSTDEEAFACEVMAGRWLKAEREIWAGTDQVVKMRFPRKLKKSLRNPLGARRRPIDLKRSRVLAGSF